MRATSGSVTLAWDQDVSTNVAGYNVYYGSASRTYTNVVMVSGLTNTTASVSNLQVGVIYYFAATAFITAPTFLESDYSTEVSCNLATFLRSSPPTSLRVKGYTYLTPRSLSGSSSSRPMVKSPPPIWRGSVILASNP